MPTIIPITDFAALGRFLRAMFVYQPGAQWTYYLRNYGVTFLVAALFSTPAVSLLAKRYGERFRWVRYAALGLVLVVSVAYLVDASYNPFLYFRF